MSEAYLCLRKGAEETIYPIQFAPEKLRLSTVGKKNRIKRDFVERKGSSSKNRWERHSFSGINLSLHLLFDKSTEDNESVRSDIEGLLNALKKCAEDTKIAFCWNNTEFSGTLKYLSAEYLMFDSQGSPVRASADLTICCQDKEGIQNLLEQDYKNLFQ